ncbi:MAG TPA: type II CRISPR-associated endonuclease Cas1 [Candidatus Kapabacteria bacterium]|nr:type II CRISPR-associated endonuclease Cas1 [Candidatus Kapabacteria bacterium]HPO62407.1 type II CRISPR-associated endonuclease Cas1 [Candidatus Kapabacteria bacterium]
MNKRIIYIGNPSSLSIKNNQLIILNTETKVTNSVPVADISVLELDNLQSVITNYTLSFLMKNSVAVIVSDETHHPKGLMLSLDDHTLQSQRFKYQLETKATLKRQLWKQIVYSKVLNQKLLLEKNGTKTEFIKRKLLKIQTGDKGNIEGVVSAFYWRNIFNNKKFLRDRDGDYPNNLLNYGYAVIRAITARALVANGLCLSIGLFHRNQYNSFCLADDIMEPYRPFVDRKVLNIYEKYKDELILNKDIKKDLIETVFQEVCLNNERKPLSNAIYHTCSSLVKCFALIQKKIDFPVLE